MQSQLLGKTVKELFLVLLRSRLHLCAGKNHPTESALCLALKKQQSFSTIGSLLIEGSSIADKIEYTIIFVHFTFFSGKSCHKYPLSFIRTRNFRDNTAFTHIQQATKYLFKGFLRSLKKPAFCIKESWLF
jgi:hypothetical protein